MKDLHSRFGFHTTPFTREIRVEDRFPLEVFDDALTALVRTVEQRMSAVLLAPPGTGKTALLRALVSTLPDARYRVRYVKVTGLSKRDMCREIAQAVGVAPAGTFPMLVRRLQEHFETTLDTDGLRPVVILDEAHELRAEVLGMIRLLTNFEMDSRLVLSVILAGQPRLGAMLRRDDLVDVARRMGHLAILRPLSREETRDYVSHRCTIAGGQALPFDQKALDALYEIGRGNLRATDHLALKSLEIAHERDHDTCDASLVAHARKMLWP